MGEYIKNTDQYELIPKRELLESLSKDQLVDFILEKGAEATEIENEMNLASEMLENYYSTSIEIELNERKIT